MDEDMPIRLIDKPQVISLKKEIFSELKTEKDRIDYVKEHTSVTIKPMRLENIMLHLIYPADIELPKSISIHFFGADHRASASSPHNLERLVFPLNGSRAALQ